MSFETNTRGDKTMRKNKELKNTFHTSEVVFLIVITCIVSLFMGRAISNPKLLETDKNQNKLIEQLLTHYEYIKENYYEEVEDEKLLNGALSGMINALEDPYSMFFDEANSDYFNMTLNGNYSGIGIEITNNSDGNIVIVGVFSNSPASKAGLQEQDIVSAINETSLLGKDKSELTAYVKENNLNEFDLTIIRNQEEIHTTVKKEIVEIPSVSSKIYERNGKKIGYIYFGIFSNTTAQQFQRELEQLEAQNIDSLIIDVRENSGGHLTTAVDIVSLFLDQTKVIYQIEKKNETTKYYSKGKTTKKYAVVVLQNKNSASASELLSAAMKESYGATIIGTTSFGKGTVQKLVTVDDSVEYKFTTEKWLTPNGNWIHEKGLNPDIMVEMDEAYFQGQNDENDNQLQEAIRYLAQ